MLNSEKLAKKIRSHVVDMTQSGNSSHVGSCLSVADILAVLYQGVLKITPKKPNDLKRDRLIFSKGHAAAALYATLAEVGFFSPARLKTFYRDGSFLAGHVTCANNPGVELSTGSLGHGLGVAVGRAKALKMNKSASRVFVILSDGECDEGSVWEAVLFAAHHKLENLVVIVDYNKIQSLDRIDKTLKLEPFAAKWRAFGWYAKEVSGHDHSGLLVALKKTPHSKGKPSVVLAHTIKGRGVSFMENSVLWHYRSPQGSEYEAAKLECSR